MQIFDELQSRKLAGSEATSAAFQPSSLKTCGCKGEEKFRRTMVLACRERDSQGFVVGLAMEL